MKDAFGELVYIGKTLNSMPILTNDEVLVDVYECLTCRKKGIVSRQIGRRDGCAECKKRAIQEHHEEEAKVGIL